MAYVGTLAINVVANTVRFASGLRKAGYDTGKFTSVVTSAAKKVAGLGMALAGIGSIGGIGYAIQRQFELVDTLAKTSDKLGLTTEALGKLRYAAKLSGVEIRTFDMGLQRMTRRLSEAAGGGGEALGALTELQKYGLPDPGKLAAMSPDKAFSRIADAMARVENQSDRVRLSFKLFDSEGVALVNTLAMGSKGLHDAGTQAERLGMLVNRFDAKKIEQANDSITAMKGGFAGMAMSAAVDLAPVVTLISEGMTGNLEKFNAQLDKTAGSAPKLGPLSEAFAWLSNDINNAAYNVVLLQKKYMELDVWTREWQVKASKMYDIIPGWRGFMTDDFKAQLAAARTELGNLTHQLDDLGSYDARGLLLDSMKRTADETAKWKKEVGGVADAYTDVAAEAKVAADRAQQMRENIDRREKDIFDAIRKRGEATFAAGRAMFDDTRSPLEKFKTDLADVDKLLKVGAISAETAFRKFMQLRKATLDELKVEVPEVREPTFAPAMLRGSVEAYEATIRAAAPERMTRSDDRQVALLEHLKALPALAQAVKEIRNRQSKPGTVEVGP